MGDDENAAGRRLGGAYVKRLRMLGTNLVAVSAAGPGLARLRTVDPSEVAAALAERS